MSLEQKSQIELRAQYDDNKRRKKRLKERERREGEERKSHVYSGYVCNKRMRYRLYNA